MVATLSFVQQKFPPSFSQARELYTRYAGLMSSMSNFANNMNQRDQNHAKTMAELANIDPSMTQLSEVAHKTNVPEKVNQDSILSQVVKFARAKDKDAHHLKLRLDQSDYKIKRLESEINLLKAEIKSMKASTPPTTTKH